MAKEPTTKKAVSETGHAVNVANLNTMISRIQNFGTRYNPSNTNIKVPNLQTVYTSANTSLFAITASKPAYTNAVNTRQQLFADMEKLSTRMENALASSLNVTKLLMADTATIIRKIRGARKDKKIVNPPSPDSASADIQKQISASQQSYDQQTESFAKLVSLVASVPTYIPNETELKTTALNTFLAQLKTANLAVVSSITPYLSAIQSRNDILYTPTTGMVDLTLAVKKYVKSVKSISLAEFRKISGLKFTRPKKTK